MGKLGRLPLLGPRDCPGERPSNHGNEQDKSPGRKQPKVGYETPQPPVGACGTLPTNCQAQTLLTHPFIRAPNAGQEPTQEPQCKPTCLVGGDPEAQGGQVICRATWQGPDKVRQSLVPNRGLGTRPSAGSSQTASPAGDQTPSPPSHPAILARGQLPSGRSHMVAVARGGAKNSRQSGLLLPKLPGDPGSRSLPGSSPSPPPPTPPGDTGMCVRHLPCCGFGSAR